LESIFLEPAKGFSPLPDTIGYLLVTGRFYKRKSFPLNYHSQEFPDKARVFQFNKFKVIKSNYEPEIGHLNNE
jgi:hypothetical protein